MHTHRFAAGAVPALALAALVVAGCEPPTPPAIAGGLNLVVVSGDGQMGRAGEELPEPLVVKATTAQGAPLRGQILNFRVVSGGGSVFAGTALTNERGIAQERWTLGPLGDQRLEVRAVDNVTGEPLVFATFTATVACRDCWTVLEPMQFGRAAAGVAEANGKLYVIGGDDGSGVRLTQVEEYNPATNAWSVRASLPSGRRALAAASINGIIYAVGGQGSGFDPVGTLEAYDPATDTWTTRASMPTPRRFLSVIAVNGLLYAIGGVGFEDNVNAVEVYDPGTDSWSSKAPMPLSRYGMGLAAVGGTIFAIGGAGGTGEPSRSVSAYDIATNTWSTKAFLPVSRSVLGAAAVNDFIYAIGGETAGPGEGAVPGRNDAYDVAADTWTPRAGMITPRSFLGVVAINGLVYTVGGTSSIDGTITATLEAYRP